MKIVVLEDEEYIAKLLNYKLSTAGYSVKLYESPENVIGDLLAEKPDLIISDVMMPYLNGVEFLKKIKLDISLKDIPVILLSALGNEEAVLKGLDAGASDYITKPFSTAELVLRVKKTLQNKH
jgi:DNA-binding response OmpR family regulator